MRDSASVFAVDRQSDDEHECLPDQQADAVALQLLLDGIVEGGACLHNESALAALSIMLPLVPASAVAVAGAEAFTLLQLLQLLQLLALLTISARLADLTAA